MLKKHDKIYVAGHKGMVGSAICRKLGSNAFDQIITRTHTDLDLTSFVAAKRMGYKFNNIAEILRIHTVTVERCSEKGKKLIDKYEGIWRILEQRR